MEGVSQVVTVIYAWNTASIRGIKRLGVVSSEKSKEFRLLSQDIIACL